MIDFDFIKECCGCGACVDSCPRQCIELVCSPYGYMVPKVNRDVCINCNKCDKVCPELNTVYEECEKRKLFSAYHKDENVRFQGSSGSVFSALAKEIFALGGIVYGAAFDDDLQLRHRKAENMDELRPLTKSKYLQSSCNGIYQEVDYFLSKNRVVMFCGTPCQCNAISNYVPKKHLENLLLVDFICHGVPSQDNFDKSISLLEKRRKKKVVSYSFREKLYNNLHGYRIIYEDDDKNRSEETGIYTKQPFYRGFKSYICFRESCYHCKHVGENRPTDITLADFWGLSSIDKTCKDPSKGYSMLIVNSEKGQSYLNRVKSCVVLKEFDLKFASAHNSSYVRPTKDAFLSKTFRKSYKYLPYWLTEMLFFSYSLSFMKRVMRVVKSKL